MGRLNSLKEYNHGWQAWARMLEHEWRLLYRYPMLTNDEQLTEIIIGAAMNVLNKLKPGLDEKLYERALVIELGNQGLVCEQQKQHPVHYDEHLIGTLIPDLIVNDTVIVDPKAVNSFNDNHIAQMLGYLNITGLKTALLLNFKHARLQIKRVFN